MTADILNKTVPDFSIKGTGNIEGKLSQFKSKNILLFFYPKDNTPVCSFEAKSFRDHIEIFNELNTVILGVSRDSIESHERFKLRLGLPFELISDTSEEMCNYFDVIAIKNFFGKKIRGVVRSTFLIDQNMELKKIWRKVKMKHHLEEVLAEVKLINE